MAMTQSPQLATTEQEIIDCYETMLELRPHLNKEDFVGRVRMQMTEGYQLVFLLNETGHQVVCVAGFRTNNNLFKGKTLYVDDLVTSSQFRSQGSGKIMLDWLTEYSSNNGYDYISLDSGMQRKRAHQFYLNNDFEIAGYHFISDTEN